MFITKHVEIATVLLLHIFLLETGLLTALRKFMISQFQGQICWQRWYFLEFI